jgi:hypothetical protein
MEKEEGGQLGGTMERDQGGWTRSGMVEILTIGSPAAVENAGVIFSGEWKHQAAVRAS